LQGLHCHKLIFSAHLSFLFADLPLLERPAAALEAGYTAVECWWPGPAAEKMFAAEVERCGLRLALINADAGDIAAGERGFLNLPERREEALARIAAAVRLRPSCVNVLVGRGRGREHVVDVLREAVDGLEAVTLVVEPQNARDVPGYLLPTAAEAAELVEDVGAPQLRLLYDAYHAAMAGVDPAADVRRYAGLIGHVQYAEAPGRAPPGPRFWEFLDVLGDLGYAGAVGLEYDPRGGSNGPPRRREHLRG
jgi:hydroxypyruvate isomerase